MKLNFIVSAVSFAIKFKAYLSIFFSYYDPYRGVIVYFRVVDGTIRKGDRIYFMASGKVKYASRGSFVA